MGRGTWTSPRPRSVAEDRRRFPPVPPLRGERRTRVVEFRQRPEGGLASQVLRAFGLRTLRSEGTQEGVRTGRSLGAPRASGCRRAEEDRAGHGRARRVARPSTIPASGPTPARAPAPRHHRPLAGRPPAHGIRGARRLHLARDRLGIEPLYWGRTPEGDLVFASQPKCFSGHPDRRPAVERAALAACLRHSYLNAPQCIYRDAFQVRPRCILTADAGGEARERRYWNAVEVVRDGAGRRRERPDDEEAVERLARNGRCEGPRARATLCPRVAVGGVDMRVLPPNATVCRRRSRRIGRVTDELVHPVAGRG